MSGFAGLLIARRALNAQLAGIEVAGQNIANANTPGYSRQVAMHATVILDSGVPVRAGEDPLALAGVEVSEFRRQYDAFLDARVRTLTSATNDVAARYDGLAQVEDLMREPGDATIGTALEGLWTAFAQLATNPTNEAARKNVLFNANTVAESFHEVAEGIATLRTEAATQAQSDVDSINSLVKALAEVNDRLVSTSVASMGKASPNALLDKRDGLLRELAQFANVQVQEADYGAVKITLAGETLLQGVQVTQLALSNNAGLLQLQVGSVPISNDQAGGSLGGEIQLYNQDLPRYSTALDDLAQSVIDQVNAIHQSSYDLSGAVGEVFFTGTGATDIALAAGLKGNPAKLAISQDPNGQDGLQAQVFADLREKPATGSSSTITSQYSSLISELGSDVRSLQISSENNVALLEYAQSRVESVSGVSIDEELIDMVRYQQAYSAAARLLTTIDETLDILINRTGLVGR